LSRKIHKNPSAPQKVHEGAKKLLNAIMKKTSKVPKFISSLDNNTRKGIKYYYKNVPEFKPYLGML